MTKVLENVKTNEYHVERKRYAIFPWVICGLGAAFYSYEYLLRISPGVMTEELMRFYNINAATFGFVAGIYYYIYTPMQLIVGLLMDRYGPKRLLTWACIICVIGAYMFGGTSNLFLAGVGRFLLGFGSAFAFVGVLKLATIWLPPNRLAMVSGMTSALGTFGAMTGTVIMTSLVTRLGWQETVIASASIGIVLAIALWLFVQDERSSKRKVHATTSHQVDFAQAFRDLVIILKTPQIWVNGIVTCLAYLPTTVFAELWGKTYLEHVYGLTRIEAAYAISTLFLGFGIGAPLSGYISDTIKRRKSPIVICTFGTFVLFTILVVAPELNKASIYFILFVIGLLYSSHVISFALGREVSPRQAAGSAIAVTNMICMLGGPACQQLVGVILDRLAVDRNFEGLNIYTAMDFRYAMSLVSIGLFIAFVLSFWLRETYCELQDKE